VSYGPLSHSRHNAGDRSTKEGHGITVKLHRKPTVNQWNCLLITPTVYTLLHLCVLARNYCRGETVAL